MGKNVGARLNERAQQIKTTSTDVAVREPGEVQQQPQTLTQFIRSMEGQFAAAMPKGAEATQLIRDALTAVRTTKDLDQCDHLTVIGALMTCAQLGLRPNVPSLGHCWLLPFKKRVVVGQDEKGADVWGNSWNAQLIMGYQGYRELAQRSGQIASVVGRVVYENDHYDVEYGLNERLEHKPARGRRGEATDYYAIVRYTNGGYTFWSLSKEEAEDHRDKYAMARKYDKALKKKVIVGPWVDEFDTMSVKTAFLKLSKWMPKTPELAAAIAADGSVRVDLAPNLDAIHHAERPEADSVVLEGAEGQVATGGDTVEGEIVNENPMLKKYSPHMDGHGKAMAWDPECGDCQGDVAGRQHYETHSTDEPSCYYCQQEARWLRDNSTGSASGATS
ncbi:hypothetical protein BBK82_03710 [Lentzea guizhouensis]|uniref:Recombinase RecT n=1 Tax=Lentzea guizhouensis TaxID=1586287 RepID=A0A1B2HC83_9PSEU|nr:recombinase RecT [Lentzea guizhouensis]ANZ35323.1 hypothetical protein BBK82_03710 [Lentzea guizhouensis]